MTVELRSLNSRQLDLQLRLPGPWRDREATLRQWLADQLVRGKAELSLAIAPGQSTKQTTFDTVLVKAYYDELQAVARAVAPNASTDLLGYVLRMPEVSVVSKEEADPEDWPRVMELVEEAYGAFDDFRRAEGGKLQGGLKGHVVRIQALLAEVEAMDAERMEQVRARIDAKLQGLQVEVDRGRFEQELVYYLEKLDVTEEKLRLATHCNYFLETMAGEDRQGRKLAFIGQEIGREVNTLGAKANDAAMQRLVVQMKDELEKVKEQVLNVL